MKGDAVGVFVGELRNGGRIVSLQLSRPFAPISVAVPLPFGDGHPGGEPTERGLVGADECVVRLRAGTTGSTNFVGEDAIERVEGEAFHRHDLLVAHAFRRAQLAQLGIDLRRFDTCAQLGRLRELGHGGDVEVDRIAKEPAHRAVRTDVGAAIEQRVERIDADEVGAPVRRPAR
jgi:hypothetical protein